MHALTPDIASRFASLALGHVRREYPNKLDHVMNGASDVRPPRELHPVFYGSFDWHSCVHGYWLLARVRRAGIVGGQSWAIQQGVAHATHPHSVHGRYGA